jgi:hypothetical protein
VEDYRDLWTAVFACLVLTAVYIVYALQVIPSGGQSFGHLIGIVGMTLMVITETAYTARKRVPALSNCGSLRLWLSFHIVTGLVGPYLVLLHSAGATSGVAGFALWMTGVVVASGFAGRYIYTSVPRTRAGIEIDRDTLNARAGEIQIEIDRWQARNPAVARMLAERIRVPPTQPAWQSVLARSWQDHAYLRRVRVVLLELQSSDQSPFGELEALLMRKRALERHIASMDAVHQLLGVWRIVHVPLGAVLFTTALVHVAAAIYFKGWRL